MRLLRARGPALAEELDTAIRWCAAKGVGVRWPSVACLTLAAFLDDELARERESHRQARAYFAKVGDDETDQKQD